MYRMGVVALQYQKRLVRIALVRTGLVAAYLGDTVGAFLKMDYLLHHGTK